MSAHEKRRFVRIHFKRLVQLDFESETEIYENCEVINISLGGMFISGNFPDKLGQQCYIHIAQKGETTNLNFKALATIVRQDDQGVGLQFISMSFESLLSLEMILLYEPQGKNSDNTIELPDDLPFQVLEEESSPLSL